MTRGVDDSAQLPPELVASRTEILLTEIREMLEKLKSPELDASSRQELIERVAVLSVEVTQIVMCRLRTHVRLQMHYPVRILGTDTSGASFSVDTFTENVSQGGACVTLAHEVKQGQPLVFFSRDYPERGALASIIRWIVPVESQWRMGVKFLTPLKDPLSSLSAVPDERLKRVSAENETESIEKPERQTEPTDQTGQIGKTGEEKPVQFTLFKTGFVNLLVHDLKGPLAAIHGVLETLEFELEGRGIKDELIGELITAGVESCQTILRLVTDLLDLAKFDSQGIMVQRVPMDIAEVARASLAEVHPLALQKQIIMAERFPADLPLILGDSKLIIRALVNLLTNAIKFTDNGGRVELEALVVEGRQIDVGRQFIVLSVTDTGEGMLPEDVPFAFDLYWQSASGKAQGGGTGLGLSMVKHIAASHGGNVSLRSQVGVGSTFSIVLPVV